MKIAILLAANVLIVGAGILTYDVMRAEAPMPQQTEDGEPIDLSAVEQRISDLERRLDGFSTIQSDRKTTTRILQVERRLASMERGVTSAAVAAAPTTESAALAVPGDDAQRDGELAAADIETVKRAMEKIDSDRNRERSARGVERLLDRLGLQLTDDQKQRLGDEFATFRGKVRDNFRNGGMEGLTREEMVANMGTLREELGTSIGEFLSATDAEAIVSEMGNGMGGGGRRGGSGGGGRRNGGGGGGAR